MFSNHAIFVLLLQPFVLMLSGCDSLPQMRERATPPEQVPQPDDVPQLRQLSPSEHVLQSECSYQCAQAGFEHHGGNCKRGIVADDYFVCWCVLKDNPEELIWQTWLDQNICYRRGNSTPTEPEYECVFQTMTDKYFGGTWGTWGTDSQGFRKLRKVDRCCLYFSICSLWGQWAGASSGSRALSGMSRTHTCLGWTETDYACTKYV